MLRFPDLELPPDHPDRGLLNAMARRLDVSTGKLGLLGSMSEYVQHGLDVSPTLRDPRQQQALTDRFLTPVLPALTSLLFDLRAELDPDLRRMQPFRGSKPYPAGQCLEITRAVQRRLESLDTAGLSGRAGEACAALREFVGAGGEVRRAWGDLRGQYFQNALIVGALYVDVANDTVVAAKPAVEILPFADAAFQPIADYSHFARIARRYWNYRFLPNHLLPQLAPYLPLIGITPEGRPCIGPLDQYMLSLTLAKGFEPSEQALSAPALHPRAFDSLGAALHGGPIPVAANPEEGRAAALHHCRSYRAQARSGCAASFNSAVVAGREINSQLARLVVMPRAA